MSLKDNKLISFIADDEFYKYQKLFAAPPQSVLSAARDNAICLKNRYMPIIIKTGWRMFPYSVLLFFVWLILTGIDMIDCDLDYYEDLDDVLSEMIKVKENN